MKIKIVWKFVNVPCNCNTLGSKDPHVVHSIHGIGPASFCLMVSIAFDGFVVKYRLLYLLERTRWERVLFFIYQKPIIWIDCRCDNWSLTDGHIPFAGKNLLWNAPPHGMLMFNFDGSHVKELMRGELESSLEIIRGLLFNLIQV